MDSATVMGPSGVAQFRAAAVLGALSRFPLGQTGIFSGGFTPGGVGALGWFAGGGRSRSYGGGIVFGTIHEEGSSGLAPG